jgi:signal transduction histidine kinase
MRTYLHGRAKALLAFLVIAALVIGGLGWVTTETLRLEEGQVQADFDRELSAQLGLALWRLDSRIAPALAREDSRPYDHYGAFFAPAVVFRNNGVPLQPGEVVEPSPLVNADLPSWMLLHFQTDAEVGWGSPQVLSQQLRWILANPKVKVPLDNVTASRDHLLNGMAGCWGPQVLLKQVELRCDQLKSQETTVLPNLAPSQALPQQELSNNAPESQANNSRNFSQNRNSYNNDLDAQARSQLQKRVKDEAAQNKPQTTDLGVAMGNTKLNGESWFQNNPVRTSPGQKAEVKLGSMVPLWLTPDGQDERLIVARLVRIGERQVCQGIVLDWPRLQSSLIEECSIHDLFPDGRLEPMRDATPPHPERTMKWLPVELDPGPLESPAVASWTPLRVGLALSWAAALVALVAVGLGGSLLLALSERRIRFVSAVTHELRTPLTTLRLYLDMLTGGMVQEEQQRSEYLHTLNSETDRLNRLVSNVLDFARLERQRPRLEKSTVATADLLEQVRADWQERCRGADKELVLDNQLPEDTRLTTDVKLVQQVLGNLIDNACKYSREAEDKRVWLRARRDGKRLALEVEDRGPGVPGRERRGIFRAFRRGRDADVTAGGVGLGLALARRWARLLGGRLVLGAVREGSGACFRVELPVTMDSR